MEKTERIEVEITQELEARLAELAERQFVTPSIMARLLLERAVARIEFPVPTINGTDGALPAPPAG